MGDHKKVLKEIETIYTTMDSMRSLVQDVEKDLVKFKGRVNDEFSWNRYQEDRKQTTVEIRSVQSTFEKDVNDVREKLAHLEE